MKTRLKLEACIFIDVIRHPKLNRPEYRHPQFYILKYLLRKLSPRVTLFSGTYPFTLSKCSPPPPPDAILSPRFRIKFFTRVGLLFLVCLYSAVTEFEYIAEIWGCKYRTIARTFFKDWNGSPTTVAYRSVSSGNEPGNLEHKWEVVTCRWVQYCERPLKSTSNELHKRFQRTRKKFDFWSLTH